MKEVLPNMRLLYLPSETSGEDWSVKSAHIDQALIHSPYDLACEAVYLFYEQSQCLIARSVIGPKKEVEGPLKLMDWQAKPVKRIALKERLWDRLLDEVSESTKASSFIICLRRRLAPDLILDAEVIFSE